MMMIMIITGLVRRGGSHFVDHDYCDDDLDHGDDDPEDDDLDHDDEDDHDHEYDNHRTSQWWVTASGATDRG